MKRNPIVAKIMEARRTVSLLKDGVKGNWGIDMFDWIVAVTGNLNGFIGLISVVRLVALSEFAIAWIWEC
ncbi:MAG: hypothetical protein ACKVGW_15090 [Verrucomicrobiia bacterium]|jgi:hypothetical protein|tara:strand:- start:262 stop:471 length:210 start_codon:yes stop_codon:yes gene_type:complete